MYKSITKFGFNYWDQNNGIKSVLCESCIEQTDEIIKGNEYKVTMDLVVHCVDSQPGDMTKYSYFVYREGYEYFHFMPKNSTFKFPQRLKFWDCKDFDVRPEIRLEDDYVMPESLIKMAQEHGCNVWTLIECIRTMNELKEGDL